MAMGRNSDNSIRKSYHKVQTYTYILLYFFYVKLYCEEVGLYLLGIIFFFIRKPSLFYEVPSNSTARPFDQVS